MKNRQATKLTDDIIILHDCVHPHVAHRVQDQLNVIQWEVLRHPAYSVDYQLQFSHPVVIKESNQKSYIYFGLLCARDCLYSGLGSSRNFLQVGYNDWCASLGRSKMCVVIYFFSLTVGSIFTYEHPGVGLSCACLIDYLDCLD
jgi:hypothetical protein